MKRKMIKEENTLKQRGFVSIIVAATVMILLSLITIGFTRVMQREQREALDRQLTRQATYAAESGINAVWQYLQIDDTFKEKNSCAYTDGNVYRDDDGVYFDIDPSPGPRVTPSPFFDANDNTASIQVTCVLYDKTPTEVKNGVEQNEESIFPLEDKDGEQFSEINVTWYGDSSGYETNCNNPNFVFPTTMGGTPILKLDLYKTNNYDRNTITNSANYFYLIPCDIGGVTDIDLVNSSRKVHKRSILCNDGVCTATLDVSGLSTNSFFVRHKLLYGSGEVILSAVNASGDPSELKNAQTIIDVTARATDVVRRLRVHVPYSPVRNIPGAVVTVGSSDLCKSIKIIDGIEITDPCY